MKNVLLSLVVASGLLMAQSNESAIAQATLKGINDGFAGSVMKNDAQKRLAAFYAEKFQPSQATMNGLALGVATLPTLLENSKIQGNMSSETLVKGCEFLVSYSSQINDMSTKEKSETLDGCMIGYSSYLVNNGKLDLQSIANKSSAGK